MADEILMLKARWLMQKPVGAARTTVSMQDSTKHFYGWEGMAGQEDGSRIFHEPWTGFGASRRSDYRFGDRNGTSASCVSIGTEYCAPATAY